MTKDRRIFGATLVGLGLVFGSYIVSDFSLSNVGADAPLDDIMYVKTNTDIEREFITVADSDSNGIEDWREEFVTNAPLIVPATGTSSEPYTPPSTVTELVGVQMFESFLLSQGQNNLGLTTESLIAETKSRLEKTNRDVLYTQREITTIPDSPAAIRQYANTMASIVINNNVPNYDSELTILDRAMRAGSEEELKKLQPLATMYERLRNESLQTPVPASLAKQHLDLINVYHALFMGLTEMQLAFSDPVVALMRLQRFPDDATGLFNGFRNMYLSIEPYASQFQKDDPALVFVVYAPNYQ